MKWSYSTDLSSGTTLPDLHLTVDDPLPRRLSLPRTGECLFLTGEAHFPSGLFHRKTGNNLLPTDIDLRLTSNTLFLSSFHLNPTGNNQIPTGFSFLLSGHYLIMTGFDRGKSGDGGRGFETSKQITTLNSNMLSSRLHGQ